MKSFNKRIIAFKNKTKMNGSSLAKLFGYSKSSISNFLNGKASPRRARREKILNYMDNFFVLPPTWNELVPSPIPDVLEMPKYRQELINKLSGTKEEVSVEVTFNAHTIASVLESASLYGTITITDISGVYTITKITKE